MLKALVRGAVRAHYPKGLMPLEKGKLKLGARKRGEVGKDGQKNEMCIKEWMTRSRISKSILRAAIACFVMDGLTARQPGFLLIREPLAGCISF